MRIIVTGANGYIGRNVVASLLAAGHHVVAVLFDSEEPHMLLEKAEIYRADIFSTSYDEMKSAFAGSDALLHLAWQAGFNHRDPSHLANVMKHYTFLTEVHKMGIKKLSIAGTMHEVGYFIGPIDSDTPCNPRNPYGIAKNFLRQAMFDFASVMPELELQWLRFYYITGDDKYSNSIFTKILKAEEDGQAFFPLNSGEMLYDFIDIQLLSAQIVKKLEAPDIGIFNCCSGKPKSLRTAVEEFISEHQLKIHPKYNVFPERPYDSMAVWGSLKL